MNSFKPIGGFFEVEPRGTGSMHDETIKMNSARSCFEYLLLSLMPKKVYMPKLTCDVMFNILHRLGIEYTYYDLEHNFEVSDNIKLTENELIIYTNYFGMKDDYCKKMEEKYGNQLIIDSSQAFYARYPKKGHIFYSPRKFFGVPDGGLLHTSGDSEVQVPKSSEDSSIAHLLLREKQGPEIAYPKYLENEEKIDQSEMESMSKITKKLLKNIDYEKSKKTRIDNFSTLHGLLEDEQKTKLSIENFSCPMFYPLISDDTDLRQRLINQKIFVPTYWPHILKEFSPNDFTFKITSSLLPLPIDQRYGSEDMRRIAETIYGN